MVSFDFSMIYYGYVINEYGIQMLFQNLLLNGYA